MIFLKKFRMLNDKFICENCGKTVEKALKTARDHCPYCLYSKHVDINPGDRSNNCQGLLKPTGVEKFKKGFKILYQCEKCKQFHKNIMCDDDNMDIIIKLSSIPK